MKPFHMGIRGTLFVLCIFGFCLWITPELQAGTLTGQLTASSTFTPYSGTNGTGNVVNDLTQAGSLVFKPGIVVGNPAGSFTGLGGTTNFVMLSPLQVNPAVVQNGPLWTLNYFSFKSGGLTNSYTSSTTIFLNGYGALRDGTNGDATVAAVSVTFSLGVPATSSKMTITTSSLTNPVPVLTIARAGSNAILTWPTNSRGFVPQSTLSSPSSAMPVWIFLTNPINQLGTNYVVTNPIAGSPRYYRLAN